MNAEKEKINKREAGGTFVRESRNDSRRRRRQLVGKEKVLKRSKTQRLLHVCYRVRACRPSAIAFA